MNPLNILVVSAEEFVRVNLAELIAKNNRVHADVTCSLNAQDAIAQIGDRMDLFNVVVCTNDAATDPRRLCDFMEDSGHVDCLIIMETGIESDEQDSSAYPFRCRKVIRPMHGQIDSLLAEIRLACVARHQVYL